MSVSPKDVIKEVLQLPSSLFFQQASSLLNAFSLAAVSFVESHHEKGLSCLPSHSHEMKTAPAKRSIPFIPDAFKATRSEQLSKDYSDSENKPGYRL